ncbi:TetR/AcrR family transcriptional regulator [Microbacterium hibisci]|uniref:TetR/AcrR family transcriptional regulator n=1 Tax=Microbacterium hibisci TaxID=2036000 RepID=UPI00194299CA|nr:TetR family transcriptional regulator C-terminal domain-containing protein [Microbacterium hibisci]
MDRRAEIILGVWRVILERGISGVSVRAVADAADVSVGLVQHYFRSKDLLIRASARAMVTGAANRYERVPTQDSVRHLVTHAIPSSDREREGVVIWHAYLAACVADPELARILCEAKAGQERELTDRLAASMPAARASIVARAVIALADGLAARVITGDLSGDQAVAAALAALDTLSPGADQGSDDRSDG